jgi:homoserine kinase
MPAVSTVIVTVPATTANLGPGFDCLGAALTLYNQFQFSRLPEDDAQPVISATGLESERVNTDETNLAYQAFVRLYQQLGQTPPPVHLAIALGIPLARGLGSSATAIVGGLVGANVLEGSPLPLAAIMELAIDLEGHPDNVVPALVGGCQLTAVGSTWTVCPVPWHEQVVPVVAIPDFELSTAAARQVLPLHYSRADAIFNAAHLGLLVRGLETGRADWLQTALQDRIHQPYRQSLIPGYEAVQAAALGAGAYGVVISGAGPSMLALAHPSQAIAVEAAMAAAWVEQGISIQAQALRIDSQGAIATRPGLK